MEKREGERIELLGGNPRAKGAGNALAVPLTVLLAALPEIYRGLPPNGIGIL